MDYLVVHLFSQGHVKIPRTSVPLSFFLASLLLDNLTIDMRLYHTEAWLGAERLYLTIGAVFGLYWSITRALWDHNSSGLYAFEEEIERGYINAGIQVKVWFFLALYIWEGIGLSMVYFDNLNNEPLNKYKKILKIEKKNYSYVFLLLDWWSFKFHIISLSFNSPLKTIKLKPLQIAWKFDGLWWTIKR
jgi:hypothetical protein